VASSRKINDLSYENEDFLLTIQPESERCWDAEDSYVGVSCHFLVLNEIQSDQSRC
jgi:hypothetical protein